MRFIAKGPVLQTALSTLSFEKYFFHKGTFYKFSKITTYFKNIILDVDAGLWIRITVVDRWSSKDVSFTSMKPVNMMGYHSRDYIMAQLILSRENTDESYLGT